MIDIEHFLADAYNAAMNAAYDNTDSSCDFEDNINESLQILLYNSEKSKAVLTVVVTSLAYKCLHPEQDIRRHQQSIPDGYSGRTFDTKYITPFLKEKRFPSMSTSGWLTRSLEQKVPYDFNYTGAIHPASLKNAFLTILDYVESNKVESYRILVYILQKLIIDRDKQEIPLARPQNLSIDNIMMVLEGHFHAKYSADGASRLPVLAMYAVYQSLVNELKRYEGMRLLPLESHTSADSRSGRIGDIDIVDIGGVPFEAVEIKFDIPISHEILQIAIDKIQPTAVRRYYILSTANIKDNDKVKIEDDIKRLKNTHGCQVVVNGIMPSLKYYLRLLEDTRVFVSHYVDLLESDKALKFEHKTRWNDLISEI